MVQLIFLSPERSFMVEAGTTPSHSLEQISNSHVWSRCWSSAGWWSKSKFLVSTQPPVGWACSLHREPERRLTKAPPHAETLKPGVQPCLRHSLAQWHCLSLRLSEPRFSFFILFFNWEKIALQCFVNVCCTTTQTSQNYTYFTSCLSFFPSSYSSPLGHHRTPSWAPCLVEHLLFSPATYFTR